MRHELGGPGGGNGGCKQAGYADEEERESMPGIHIGVGNRSHERMWRRVERDRLVFFELVGYGILEGEGIGDRWGGGRN